ncbi:MAG: DUF4178 domain-containing protein [Thiolinea sp.]
MSDRKLRSIRCTHCGAPLTLYGGGHKIRTLNCEFCGSVLDVRQEYQVLHRFSNQERPACPFTLGMQGQIKGMAFTIIGVVAWEDVEQYQWVDLLLFSETRGYAWLTYYQGHLMFSRRTRELPNVNVWNLAPKFKFRAGTREYRFFERYRAHIVYVAGELTWIASQGDSSLLLEAIDPPHLYTVERNDSEVEYGLGEYLEDRAAVFKSFGITDKPARLSTIHPAQPYRSRFFTPLSKAARPFVAVAAMAALLIWLFFGGTEIYSEQLDAAAIRNGAGTHEFEVTRPNSLLALKVDTQLQNAWSFFDINIRQGANDIFSIGKEVSFYEGRDDEGYWSEGSRSATALFKVPAAGNYSLHITQAEGGTGESSGAPPATTVNLTLKQGYVSSYYFVWLLVISAIATLSGFIARRLFETKRWKTVLGDDDE